MEPLNQTERELMTHLSRWGSDGYPIVRLGKRWSWEFRGLKLPMLVKTRREAVASFEAYYNTLRERSGYEAQQRALAERIA